MTVKIVESNVLSKELNDIRESGKQVVFTNGCFDILHVGHIRYLSAARGEGDLLVVGINSDASVREIKGDNRPIVPQDQRAEVLAALWCVDFVTLFNEPDPLNLIRMLKPDILVKGEDWPEENIIGADVVKAHGGRVARMKFVPGASTTDIIQRILKLNP